MSIVPPPLSNVSLPLEPRKRTSSFSYPNQSSAFPPNPRPSKAPRVVPPLMGSPLRRTESYICLADVKPTSTATTTTRKTETSNGEKPPSLITRSVRDRERRKVHVNRSVEPISIRLRPDPVPQPSIRQRNALLPAKPIPLTPPPQQQQHQPPSRQYVAAPVSRSAAVPPPTVFSPPRKSSPLAPTRVTLSSRPLFPRSKPEPDLYRKALKTSMKSSPEGQKILRMGPRLAVTIMNATKDLERLVAAHVQQENSEPQDIVMADATSTTITAATATAVPPPPPALPVLSKSWVVVPMEDWEMVECVGA